MTDSEFMREALREAALAGRAGEVPVGAVAVRAGEILAWAGNRVERDGDGTSHAEMLVLKEAAKILGGWRLDDVTVYVTKEPCPMCAGAMVNAHLEKVVFGFSDPKYGGCGGLFPITGSDRLLWNVETVPGVLQEECLAQFRAFFRAVRSGERPKPRC